MVRDRDEVHARDVQAKIPRETTKTKDIMGGLPRVVELFEARKPRSRADLSRPIQVMTFYRQVKIAGEDIVEEPVPEPTLDALAGYEDEARLAYTVD